MIWTSPTVKNCEIQSIQGGHPVPNHFIQESGGIFTRIRAMFFILQVTKWHTAKTDAVCINFTSSLTHAQDTLFKSHRRSAIRIAVILGTSNGLGRSIEFFGDIATSPKMVGFNPYKGPKDCFFSDNVNEVPLLPCVHHRRNFINLYSRSSPASCRLTFFFSGTDDLEEANKGTPSSCKWGL